MAAATLRGAEMRRPELSSSRFLVRVACGGQQRLGRASRRLRSSPAWSSSRGRSVVVKDEMGGDYEEAFTDVSEYMMAAFTFKAVKTVLRQLQETDPTKYKWLYDFTAEHKPGESYNFCKALMKTNRELGERVLVTRQGLAKAWMKHRDHLNFPSYITKNNLQIMRDLLDESVNFVFTAKPRPDVNE